MGMNFVSERIVDGVQTRDESFDTLRYAGDYEFCEWLIEHGHSLSVADGFEFVYRPRNFSAATTFAESYIKDDGRMVDALKRRQGDENLWLYVSW